MEYGNSFFQNQISPSAVIPFSCYSPRCSFPSRRTILMDYMDAETGVERPQLSMFSQEESAGFLAFDHQSRPYNKDNQAEGEHMRNHEGAFLAEKDKCFSEDEHDLRNLEATVEKLQEVGELEIRNASSEAGALSEGDKFLANEDHDVNNLDTTFERLREDGKFAKEKRDFNIASLLDGETRELRGAETTLSFATEEANKPSEIVLFESPEPDVVMKDHSLSLRIDSTPPTKLPNIAQGLDFSLKNNGRIYLQRIGKGKLGKFPN